MNERVMEIIAYIVNEMSGNAFGDDNDDFQLLSQKLVDSGYTTNEINFAFSWIMEKANIDFNSRSEFSNSESHRILHEFEKVAISPEAFGYLIQLCEFDIIDQMEMEQIIEKAVLYSKNPVSVNEMREIVASTILKPEDVVESSFFVLDKAYNVH